MPTPLEAKLSWPGFALASATSSFTDLAGRSLVTTSTVGAIPSSVIGAKSRIGS